MDRTARNTNMLMWNKELWLIDHGAALYFHHSPNAWNPAKPFPLIQKHVLLPVATEIQKAGRLLKTKLSNEKIQQIVNLIPSLWLERDDRFVSAEEHRKAYSDYLEGRLAQSELFVKEIEDARAALV
jgi:hypothetical protein